MSLQSTFSKIAESPNFIAFNAHFGFAFATATAALHYGAALRWVVIVGVALAALKEFWIDLKYETDPPQTFGDSLGDFVGYMVGLDIACQLAMH